LGRVVVLIVSNYNNICCDWTEYKNIEAARKEYRVGVDGDLEDNTIVLKHDSGIVVVLNF
jgi:hypothetical protein